MAYRKRSSNSRRAPARRSYARPAARRSSRTVSRRPARRAQSRNVPTFRIVIEQPQVNAVARPVGQVEAPAKAGKSKF